MKNIFDDFNYFTDPVQEIFFQQVPGLGTGETPPVYIFDPPVKPMFLSISKTFSGAVKDASPGNPIPGATIQLIKGTDIVNQTIADGAGLFSITTKNNPDSIKISAAEFKTWTFPATIHQHSFELERIVKTLDPVILLPGIKNKNLMLWVIAALVIAKYKKWI